MAEEGIHWTAGETRSAIREPALDQEYIMKLVARHAPVLHMHHRDAFMPCSVEWFMDHSELWLRSTGVSPSSLMSFVR